MHPAAHEWVARYATNEPVTVLDIGGRNINGTCRDLYPNAPYTALDLHPGPGVDIVADAATWQPDEEYDIVLSTEVFEHTPDWPAICATAFKACADLFVVTAAGPGRGVHSGIDGEWRLLDGEHYENIHPDRLRLVLIETGFADIEVDVLGLDVRAVARK